MAKAKVAKITVEQRYAGPDAVEFLVIRLQNTVEFQIMQVLPKEEVAKLCASPLYDVSIVPKK